MEQILDKDVERVLFSQEELARRVSEIAAEIDRDYAGKEPLLVSVLRGSFVFMADLVRQIHLPCTVDFMAVSPYGAGTASSGQVKIVKDLSEHIEGKDVIVVEDTRKVSENDSGIIGFFIKAKTSNRNNSIMYLS